MLQSKWFLYDFHDDVCVKNPCNVPGAEAGQGDSPSGVCSAVVVPQAGNEGSVSCCGVRCVCGRQGGDVGTSVQTVRFLKQRDNPCFSFKNGKWFI